MELTGINIDFVIAAAVIGVSALVLHFKSHVKFVALGVFIGLVLLDLIPFAAYFASSGAESFAKLAVLVVPALVLGINHVVDKRKKGSLVWKALFVMLFTLFFLSSIAQVLPFETQEVIRNRSILGWQVLGNHTWFTLAAAAFIMLDSVYHRNYVEKSKKRKKKKKSDD